MVSLSQCVRVSAIIFGKADVKILLKVNPSKEAFSGAVPCLVIIRLFLTLLRSLSSIKRQGFLRLYHSRPREPGPWFSNLSTPWDDLEG